MAERCPGWLTPVESGDYRFFTASDDSSRLFLSTDSSQANVSVICEETDCCDGFVEPGVMNDDGSTTATSEPISLVGGKKYYIEVIWKEGTGGDVCNVAWRKEGDTTPAAQLPNLRGQYLSTYADPAPANVNITLQPQSVATTENKSATFMVEANGTPAPFILQWQRANPGSSTFVSIVGATTASYTTPLLKKALDDGAKYPGFLLPCLGRPCLSAEVALTVNIDNVPPTVVRAVAGVDLHKRLPVVLRADDRGDYRRLQELQRRGFDSDGSEGPGRAKGDGLYQPAG